MLKSIASIVCVNFIITSDDSDIFDTRTGAIDEAAPTDVTDQGVPSDDKNADDPSSVDTSMAVDNEVDNNTVDPKATAIDGAAPTDATNVGDTPDDKDSDDPNVEDAMKDNSEENTKNKDADGSGETKA